MIKNKKIKMEQCTLSTGKVVIISDIHIPFQDNKAVGAAFDYINKVRPKVVVLNGDIVDFFKLSHFTKGEGRNPAQEIKECQKLFKQLKKVLDEDAKIYYVIGNHETRLEKYVLQNAPEVASIIDDVFSILEVEKYGIVGCSQVLFNKLFLCRHGKLLGKYSGMSAMKELAASYTSGASGHSHRLSLFICRKNGIKYVWMETGGLMDMNPTYIVNPDWQQGFGVVEFYNKEIKHAYIKQIENGVVLDE